MTKQEAINAMIEGHKVTHDKLTNDWVKSSKNGLIYESKKGVILYRNQFWKLMKSSNIEETGWEIFKES